MQVIYLKVAANARCVSRSHFFCDVQRLDNSRNPMRWAITQSDSGAGSADIDSYVWNFLISLIYDVLFCSIRMPEDSDNGLFMISSDRRSRLQQMGSNSKGPSVRLRRTVSISRAEDIKHEENRERALQPDNPFVPFFISTHSCCLTGHGRQKSQTCGGRSHNPL